MKVFNVVGNNFLYNITSSYLLIIHNMKRDDSRMEISNYNHVECSYCKHTAIEVLFYKHSQFVKVIILHLKLNVNKAMSILSISCKGISMLTIKKMELTHTTFTENIIAITIINSNSSVFNKITHSSIQFLYCSFTNIKGSTEKGGPELFSISKHVINRIQISAVLMLHCRFSNINASAILRTQLQGATSKTTVLLMFVQNTSFSMIKVTDSVLWLEGTYLKLGPVMFTKYQVAKLLSIQLQVQFKLKTILHFHIIKQITSECIILLEQSKLEIVANNFSVLFYAANGYDKYNIMCLFQYESLMKPR